MSTKTAWRARRALLAGKPFRSDNTRVDIDEGVLWLYRSAVVRRVVGGWLLSTCGWPTNTTFDRLGVWVSGSLYRSRGVIYVCGHRWRGDTRLVVDDAGTIIQMD